MVGGVKDIITSHFKQTQPIIENQENQKSYKKIKWLKKSKTNYRY